MTLLARVYLVRHGETNENRHGVIQGQLDTSLNGLGLEQARLVGNALRSIPFEFAYSSDLSRAVSTAEEILVHQPNVTVHQKQQELRERHMGESQGKTMRTKGLDKTMESGAFFAARAESWWMKHILEATASLPRKNGPYCILVTTHGGFIGALIRTLMQRRKARCAEGVVMQRCLNSSITIVDVDVAGQGLITSFGDVAHLRGLGEGTVQNNVDDDEELERGV